MDGDHGMYIIGRLLHTRFYVCTPLRAYQAPDVSLREKIVGLRGTRLD